MKNKDKFLFFSTLGVAILAVAATGFASFHGRQSTQLLSKAGNGPYELLLDEAAVSGQLDADYQDNVEIIAETELGNNVVLNMTLAKASSGNLVQLANKGMIYNLGSEDGRISGISSIEANFDGDLVLRTSSFELSSVAGGGALLEDAVNLTSGNAVPLNNGAKYFALYAGDSGAIIEDLIITYSCVEPAPSFDSLVGTYTGLSDGVTYQLDVSRSGAAQNVSLRSLNASTPTNLSGTAVVSGDKLVSTIVMGYTFTYTSQIQQDGRLLKFVSVDPAGLPNIDFYRVYDVEDFEDYSELGQGWDQGHGKAVTAGLRGDWYSDYNSGGSGSPIGGSGWSLMGGSYDYIQFSENQGRNDSKCIAFKGNNNSLRYIQMKAYYGIPSIIGRGAKLSFWAAGAYSDKELTTKGGTDAVIQVRAYWTPLVNSSNHGSARDSYQVTIPANSDWKEYTLSLSTDKNYYAVCFFCKQSGTTYTPIDDIKIYSYSPYVEYHAVTGVTLNQSTAEVDIGKTLKLTATVAPSNATFKNVVWTSSDESVATVANGVVTPAAVGTAVITAKTEEGNFTDTCTVTVNPQPVYLSGTFIGSVNVTLMGNSASFPIAIASGDRGYIEFAFNGQPTGVSKYTNDGTSFLIRTINEISFNVTGIGTVKVASGTITGSIADGTFKNCSFTNAMVNDSPITPNNNGSITFTKQDSGNSLLNNCDGDTATLKSIFERRYHDGSKWIIDNNNANKIESSTTIAMDGAGSLKFRGYSTGKAALNLKNNIPEAYISAFNNISFWIYNGSDSVIPKARFMLFTVTDSSFTTFNNIASYDIQPGWNFITCGYSGSIYNIHVYSEKVPTDCLYFDNVCLYHS